MYPTEKKLVSILNGVYKCVGVVGTKQFDLVRFATLPPSLCLSRTFVLSTSFTCPLSLRCLSQFAQIDTTKQKKERQKSNQMKFFEIMKRPKIHEIKSVAATSHKNATSFETFPVPSAPVSFRIDGHSKDDSSNRWNIFSRFDFCFRFCSLFYSSFQWNELTLWSHGIFQPTLTP